VNVPAVQKTMRETLLVLSSRASSNLTLQKQILSAAFDSELDQLSTIVNDLFQDKYKLFHLTIHDIEGSPNAKEVSKIISFIAETISSFTQATSKIEQSSNWNSSIWNSITETTFPTEEQLFNVFPISFLWKKLLLIIFQLLTNIHEYWSFDYFQQARSIPAFQSNVSSGGGGGGGMEKLNYFYGPSSTDMKKYLGTKEEATAALTSASSTTSSLLPTGGSGGGAALTSCYCRENIRNLLSILYKSLGLAARQRVLYYLFPFPSSAIPSSNGAASLDLSSFSSSLTPFHYFLFHSLSHLENCYFIIFVRYFLESYVINCVPTAYTMMITFLSKFLFTSSQRLSMIWNDSGLSLTSINPQMVSTNDQFYFLMISQNFLLSSSANSGNGGNGYFAFSSNAMSSFKENMKYEVTRVLSELYGTIFGLRGGLATPNLKQEQQDSSSSSSSSSSSASGSSLSTKQDRLNRRSEIIQILFSESYRSINSLLIRPFFQLLVALLIRGESVTCKEILTILNPLIYFSIFERSYCDLLGNEIFGIVLSILLKSVSSLFSFAIIFP
jgi:hypothetical protein